MLEYRVDGDVPTQFLLYIWEVGSPVTMTFNVSIMVVDVAILRYEMRSISLLRSLSLFTQCVAQVTLTSSNNASVCANTLHMSIEHTCYMH